MSAAAYDEYLRLSARLQIVEDVYEIDMIIGRLDDLWEDELDEEERARWRAGVDPLPPPPEEAPIIVR